MNETMQENPPVEMLDLIRYAINLSTIAGFVAAYEGRLAVHGNKGLAYEETEAIYELYYSRRKYLDCEVFRSALGRYRKQQRQCQLLN